MDNFNTEEFANMGIHAKAKLLMKPEDIDTQESDLYLRVNAISRKLVGEYEYRNLVTTFIDNIDHELWYDIPFQNMDFDWERKY